MAKPVIVTRLGKGSELSFQEGDNNFTNLRDATISVSGDSGTTQNIELNGTILIAGGTGVSTEANNGQLTISGFSGDYTDLTNKPSIPTDNSELSNGAGYITGIIGSDVTTALTFTPEDSSKKGQANGYAGLDANGFVPAAQLPSFVEEVLEFAAQANFPAEGESGKIYIAIDTGRVYRWSGSVYVEIVASPGSTDEVTEGQTNLYFTEKRARDSFTAGTNISITNGVIAVDGTFGISSVGEDTAPQLGGNLDINGFAIISSGVDEQGEIVLQPGSGGTVQLITDGLTFNPTVGTESFITAGLGFDLILEANDAEDTGILTVKGDGSGDILLETLGRVVVDNIVYKEEIHSLGTTSGSITPDVANGNVQTVTLSGNATINGFANASQGQSLTLIITQDATGSRTLTTNMLMAGGEATLSTDAGAVDILSIFFDGSTYYGSLSTGFATPA